MSQFGPCVCSVRPSVTRVLMNCVSEDSNHYPRPADEQNKVDNGWLYHSVRTSGHLSVYSRFESSSTQRRQCEDWADPTNACRASEVYCRRCINNERYCYHIVGISESQSQLRQDYCLQDAGRNCDVPIMIYLGSNNPIGRERFLPESRNRWEDRA